MDTSCTLNEVSYFLEQSAEHSTDQSSLKAIGNSHELYQQTISLVLRYYLQNRQLNHIVTVASLSFTGALKETVFVKGYG